ncbi:ABC transporter substrate-binding protein [Aliarcobacter cryaerophilus]|uniref:ABC transporter substrate-binding protein n=1 Tax=Aliarcobacter cryaerophilus TaxID=28198 RepID=UPI0021B170B7|nr:ABC transporter substrate-binding protein [Aliarcobacter cryaerophilus]MCT7444545.1 ABC transporter substrate-binding protein [Aliarcobacter cryaerophilus]MCT7479015.1 ABC transporter substrate-binding protein [Aliarcobacter cryaerophilus]MCT7481817.1 ABC transporter substrate-binding protein [Aliarcobacter cryaerophilus]MCT7483901.1 ABC transporter substrate-binding protein [Aliarcobacter cryaerophilus]MCT7494712.1 ABC transporter substrate-binding protein [Aliarcobacter cryaerophilus]
MFKIVSFIFSIAIFLNAQIYEDMLGTKIEIKKVEKIHVATPTLLYSLYAIDKDKIAGLNFPFNEDEAKYIDEKIVNLPVLGGWFGQGRVPNSEMILQTKPDVILLSDSTKKMGEKKLKSSLGNIDVPLVYLKSNTLEELVLSFSYIGKLVDKEERAKELENYGNESLNLAKEIAKKVDKKPKVYYAEGNNGLLTDCNTSIHSELINLASGDNVHKCQATNSFGKEAINFEQVLNYNPEIILVYEKEFYKNIYKDKKWQLIDAVKNKKVYFLPKGPFSWFDRPPSFMRLLGLKYVISILHPDLYELDIYEESKKFYKLFLDLDLNDSQIDDILGKNI